MSPSGTSSFDFHQDLNPSNSVPQVRLRPVVLVAISCRRDEGKSDTPHALVRPCKYACLPACLPAWLPACLPVCLHVYMHTCMYSCHCMSVFVCIANPSCGMQSGIHPCEAERQGNLQVARSVQEPLHGSFALSRLHARLHLRETRRLRLRAQKAPAISDSAQALP